MTRTPRLRWFSLFVGTTLIAGALAALALGAPQTRRPIVIRLGTVAPQGSSWHNALMRMRQEWRRISNGRVDLKIYAGTQGGENEMVRKVQRRTLDAVALSGAGLYYVYDGVACLNIPLMISSYEELDYIHERIAPTLDQRIAERGYQVLNWSDAGWVHFFTKKPARTLDDIRGMKLWTSAGDPDTERLFRQLGFRVIPLPVSDLLTSLQTGLIEAFDVPPLFAMLDGSYKQAPNMVNIKWAPLMAATVISRRSWEKIPENLREPLLEAAREAGDRAREEIRRGGDDAIKAMQQRGLNVIELSAAEAASWRAETEEAYPQIRGTLAPEDLFDEVRRLRDEIRSRRARSPASQ